MIGKTVVMKLTKAPQSMVDLFEAVFPGPPAESRKMFGYPAGFVNGNMFMGLFQDYMVLRLPEDVREELIEKSGARRFEPMPGRAMTEYVVVSGSLISDRAALKKQIA